MIRRRPLVLLIVAALLPLVILSAVLGIASLRQQQRATDREALGYVEHISALLERELASQVESLRTIAHSPLLDGPANVPAFSELLQRVKADRPLWLAIVLSDPDGNRLVDLPEAVGGVRGGKVVDEISHAHAVGTRKPVVGSVRRGPRDRPAFAVRAPVVRGNSVSYVISAVVDPTAVRDLLFATGRSNEWLGAVIDGEGRLVARKTGPSSAIGELASESARSARARAPAGIYEGTSSEGLPTVTAYRVLPESNWSVHIALPRDVYMAPVSRAFWLMIGGAALSLFLVAAFLWLLMRETRLSRDRDAALAEAQRLEALGKMTGGVAHDFNNLLMIMQGSADALKRRSTDPERVNTLADAILSAADRAQGITRQLLAFARRSPHEPTTFELQSRAAEITGFLRRSTRGNIEATFSVEPATWPIRADPHALEVALINLAANARDAMPEGGRLRASARNVVLEPGKDQDIGLVGEYVAITVEDTGSGIPDEHLGRIFEPFYTTKGSGKGTGLGLSQVYGFAKQSAGDVKVTSHLGQGTIFTIYLPRSKEAPADETTVIVCKEKVAEGRILLVEDNQEVAQVTESMLVAVGYTATWVNNASSALQLIERDNSLDVVLSDIVMEGISGLELADHIRERRPELPIVLMTGYSEALARGSSQGIPILSKPFRQSELLSSIEAARACAIKPTASNVVRLSK